MFILIKVGKVILQPKVSQLGIFDIFWNKMEKAAISFVNKGKQGVEIFWYKKCANCAYCTKWGGGKTI